MNLKKYERKKLIQILKHFFKLAKVVFYVLQPKRFKIAAFPKVDKY